MAEAIDCAYSVEGTGEPLVLIHGIGVYSDYEEVGTETDKASHQGR